MGSIVTAHGYNQESKHKYRTQEVSAVTPGVCLDDDSRLLVGHSGVREAKADEILGFECFRVLGSSVSRHQWMDFASAVVVGFSSERSFPAPCSSHFCICPSRTSEEGTAYWGEVGVCATTKQPEILKHKLSFSQQLRAAKCLPLLSLFPATMSSRSGSTINSSMRSLVRRKSDRTQPGMRDTVIQRCNERDSPADHCVVGNRSRPGRSGCTWVTQVGEGQAGDTKYHK